MEIPDARYDEFLEMVGPEYFNEMMGITVNLMKYYLKGMKIPFTIFQMGLLEMKSDAEKIGDLWEVIDAEIILRASSTIFEFLQMEGFHNPETRQ